MGNTVGVTDLFSKRNKTLPDVFVAKPIPQKFRNQVYQILSSSWLDFSHYRGEHLSDKISDILCREHGLFTIYPPERKRKQNATTTDDIAQCVIHHKDTDLFLDLIELVFKRMHTSSEFAEFEMDVDQGRSSATRELNHRFRENGLGYEFDVGSMRLLSKDNEFVHQEAVRPTLELLSDSKFSTANKEYLEAFSDFKDGKFGDCVTKCCAAFESVMKIVCNEKGWQYDEQKATAGPLVSTIIQQCDLPNFLDQPLMIIATLRNRVSTAHGAGNSQRVVDETLARYALNVTASSIMLVVQASR